MKVNIGIELDDGQRDCLADWLDGKTSKRLATRKDVVGMVDALVMGIIDSHATAGYQTAGATPDPVDTFEDCDACGGLGCDECDDGVVTSTIPATQPAAGPAAWESHPRLTTFATQINAGISAHGYDNSSQIRSYMRGWTLKPFGANR